MSQPDLSRIAATLEPSSFPRKLAIEVCAACNLACTMCHHPAMRRPKGKIPFELFRRCADEVATVAPATECWFSFCGEPLLEPDLLLSMIEYGKEVGLRSININSNGMLLTPDLSERILDSGVDLLVFGVDGFSRETYERIRSGGVRDVLYGNIEELLQRRQARTTGPDVQVQFIEMHENEHELQAFKDHWLDRGAVVKVRNQLSWGGQFATPLQVAQEERIPCPWALTMMHVFWDGRVPRCPGDTEGEEGAGNAWDETLTELWGRLGGYREMHLSRRFDLLPERCTTCKDWMVGSASRIRPAQKSERTKTLYLCGASNAEGVRLAQAVIRAGGRWERAVLLDDDATQHGRSTLGVEVVGPFTTLEKASPEGSAVVNLVARTTKKRAAARVKIEAHGLPFASLVDPGVDTDGVDLGRETTVYEQAILCPGAVLNARVELADGVYVGSNATVLPEVKIGAWATVGAGSVVLEDVPLGATVFGVPAQILATDGRSGIGTVPAGEALRPVAEIELEIAAIWRDVLRLDAVDPQVNFFDLGGNSLRAIQVCARLQEAILHDLAITDLFRFPTVSSLARHVSLCASVGKDGNRNTPEDRGLLRRRILLARGRVDSEAPA